MLEPIIEGVVALGPWAGFRAAVEIAVLAYAIYQFVRAMRGSRGVPAAFGVALLVGAYYLARVLGLSAVESVLEMMAPYAGVALIVIFQTELRGALREMALKFSPAARRRREKFEYEDIVFALSQLAATKVGALIVIERETGLRTYVQSGVPLDARLSSDLLVSVFQRSTPLHDGGIIVQKSRIAAAACFLPLTTTPGLVSTLGTRHRAAIGVTEESDCVALVVSETDGRISIAYQGSIERGVSIDYLRTRLIDLFGPVVSPPHAIPDEPPPDGAASERLAAPGTTASS